MNIVVVQERESWDVWVTLDDHDPLKSSFGFCIGTAATRDRAVENAVEELEAAVEKLQQPPGAPPDQER